VWVEVSFLVRGSSIFFFFFFFFFFFANEQTIASSLSPFSISSRSSGAPFSTYSCFFIRSYESSLILDFPLSSSLLITLTSFPSPYMRMFLSEAFRWTPFRIPLWLRAFGYSPSPASRILFCTLDRGSLAHVQFDPVIPLFQIRPSG